MPTIQSAEVGIAFDMHGCPNRCRHCYLNRRTSRYVSEDEVRQWTARFREFTRRGEDRPAFERLKIATSFLEPDAGEDYRLLYDLEAELSDGLPARFELLSIWRLARDPEYATWAAQVGPGKCQITLFGLLETTDWFCRRAGAFDDAMTATERLLEAGIKPRWQLILTKKLIPELPELLKLIESMRLGERVAALGSEFELFMHTPGPDGWAREIEHLRPTVEDMKNVPDELIQASRDYLKQERLYGSEAELTREILAKPERFPYAYQYPEHLWFFVTGELDVFANMGDMEPWWCLGNLDREGVQGIVDAFESNRPAGLRTIYTVPAAQLVRDFGDPQERRIYSTADDLLGLYVARHCSQLSG